jgi:hypothetical protein
MAVEEEVKGKFGQVHNRFSSSTVLWEIRGIVVYPGFGYDGLVELCMEGPLLAEEMAARKCA